MECLAIRGIGVISNLGNDVDTIWYQLNQEKEINSIEKKIFFNSGLTLSQKRRANRYSEMGIYVSRMALRDSKINFENIDRKNIGTIFTTGYGPLNSSLKFSEDISEGDFDLVSPALFANTVNNACIGHICMVLDLKGASTMFTGSNNISYSQFLINKENNDYIVTGGIEEHCEELFNAFKVCENSKGILIKEGAVAFLVGKASEENNNIYCNIINTLECNINAFPVVDKVDKKNSIKIENIIKEITKTCEIDAFFSSCNNSCFDELELKAAKNALKKDVIFVNNIKKYFGETLGSSFNINTMIAAICLKKQKIPFKLDVEKRKVNSILVSGYDVSGNYMLSLLKSN